jgi:hypothetical protein
MQMLQISTVGGVHLTSTLVPNRAPENVAARVLPGLRKLVALPDCVAFSFRDLTVEELARAQHRFGRLTLA